MLERSTRALELQLVILKEEAVAEWVYDYLANAAHEQSEMEFDQYFSELQNGTLNVFLADLRVMQGTDLLAQGTGHIRIDTAADVFHINADVDLEPGIDDLPEFVPLQLIPVERDLLFTGRGRDGEVVSARSGSISVSRDWSSQRLIIEGSFSQLNVRIKTARGTKGSTFFGVLPGLPSNVYDRSSYIKDNNSHFNRSAIVHDWLTFDAANATFVVRSSADGMASVKIYTPFKTDQVHQLPRWLLTVLGLRVGRELDWICTNWRSNGIDAVTLNTGHPPRKISGLLQPMILKPYTNIPLVADCVQFLCDYPHSPIGPLQYAIWRADAQRDFGVRELALGVAVEGISKFIVEKYPQDLHGQIAIQINRDKAILRKTKQAVRTRMQGQKDLQREPYFGYLLKAMEGAKPYSAGDRIKKSIELLCPDAGLSLVDIKAWQDMRNSAAHATSSGIDQQRLDNFVLCERLWQELLCNTVLSNPKHLSQVWKRMYSHYRSEIAESAYFLSIERTGLGFTDERNWLDGEEHFIRAKRAQAQSASLDACRAALGLSASQT